MTSGRPESVLRVLLVDDEPLARARLRTLLASCRHPAAEVAGEAGNAEQAAALLCQQPVDVVFLDIHMPGSNGMAWAHTLRAQQNPPAVVFVTAHAEHAVDAFELAAVDYLTKPVRLGRLQESLQKAERFAQSGRAQAADLASEDVLVIQERNRTERVPLSQVLYFKAELKYLTVRTASRSYIMDGALNDLEQQHGGRFIRIHRNALVARKMVRSLEKHFDTDEGEGWAVRLQGVDEKLMVSRRQLPAVRALVSQ